MGIFEKWFGNPVVEEEQVVQEGETDVAQEIAALSKKAEDLKNKTDFGPDDADEVKSIEDRLYILKSSWMPEGQMMTGEKEE